MKKKMQYACLVDTWYFAGHAFKTPLVSCVHKKSKKICVFQCLIAPDFKV